jgi:hypothetical protein
MTAGLFFYYENVRRQHWREPDARKPIEESPA